MVDFYDIRVIDGSSLSIVLDNGEIKEVSNNFSRGASARALKGGSWGFASSDDIDRLDAVKKSAIKIAEQTHSKRPRERINLAQVARPEPGSLPLVVKNPENISIEEKVELLKNIDTASRVKGISSTSAVYSEARVHVRYMSSEDADLEYQLRRVGFAITAVASSDGVYQIGQESRFGVCGFELFDRYDALALAEKAGKTAVGLLTAEVPRGGMLPVILDPELAGVFIHEAVGHGVEADHVIEGNSVLEDKLGERIASPLITIYDDPSIPEYGYYPFDDEGAGSNKTTIIEEGVLKSYLHSRETAGKLGGTSRNARAMGYARPLVRMSNTYIEKGNLGFEEMLEQLKNGIYLIGSRGGQVNPGEGIFQFNAERGYLVEGGKTTKPFRDVSLSGDTLEILKNVEGVGNDLEMHSGRCGKAGQLVPVSDGAPHILVSRALVGGRG